jgi:predicted TIM-barrel fold metal-dependent hydrolase
MKTKGEFLMCSALSAPAEPPSSPTRFDQGSKKYTVVDAQFHHVPSAVFKKVDETVFESKEGRALQERNRDPQTKAKPVTQRLQNIETSLRHMDECGVDMAMIMMPGWEVAGVEVCRILNDGLAKAAKEYPGRFLSMAAVPFIEGQRSIDELDRVKNDLGMKGVSILTNQRGIRLDDEQLRPFFRKVVQLGLPVVVHPPTQERGLWGGTKYDMDGSISREYEIIKCFVEVLRGVLPEFPDLNFVFAHYGGGVPSLLGRIMSWYTPPESARIPKREIHLPMTLREFEEFGFKSYFDKLLDRVYFDMAGTGGWMLEVNHALSVIKPERLAFASDYPHEMSRPADYKAYLNGIKGLDIPEEDKIKILGGNMRALFKA